MMWDGGFGMGVGWILGWIVMVVVLALIVGGIVLLVRGLSSRREHDQAPYSQAPPPAAPGARSALQILEERYARGEIDREEFLRRKTDLTS